MKLAKKFLGKFLLFFSITILLCNFAFAENNSENLNNECNNVKDDDNDGLIDSLDPGCLMQYRSFEDEKNYENILDGHRKSKTISTVTYTISQDGEVELNLGNHNVTFLLKQGDTGDVNIIGLCADFVDETGKDTIDLPKNLEIAKNLDAIKNKNSKGVAVFDRNGKLQIEIKGTSSYLCPRAAISGTKDGNKTKAKRTVRVKAGDKIYINTYYSNSTGERSSLNYYPNTKVQDTKENKQYSCFDSDGGIFPFLQDRVLYEKGGGKIVTEDYCIDNKTLAEQICVNNPKFDNNKKALENFGMQKVTCKYGCENGACKICNSKKEDCGEPLILEDKTNNGRALLRLLQKKLINPDIILSTGMECPTVFIKQESMIVPNYDKDIDNEDFQGEKFPYCGFNREIYSNNNAIIGVASNEETGKKFCNVLGYKNFNIDLSESLDRNTFSGDNYIINFNNIINFWARETQANPYTKIVCENKISKTPIPTDTIAPTNIIVLKETPLPTATNTTVPTTAKTLVPTDTPTLAPTNTNTPLPTDTPTLTQTNTNTFTYTNTYTPIPIISCEFKNNTTFLKSDNTIIDTKKNHCENSKKYSYSCADDMKSILENIKDCELGCDNDNINCKKAQCDENNTDNCKDNTPYCDVESKKCVECLENDNCVNPKKNICNLDNHTCVECVNDENCEGTMKCENNACIDTQKSIIPIFNCIQDNYDGTFTAYFGYENPNEEEITIKACSNSKGIINTINDLTQGFCEQTSSFESGRIDGSFYIIFNNKQEVTWTLQNSSKNAITVKANSDSTKCADIEPTFQCIDKNENGTFKAHFGYINKNDLNINIPIGINNNISLGDKYQYQPIEFLSGNIEGAFSIEFSDKLSWNLNKKTVNVTSNSKPCMETNCTEFVLTNNKAKLNGEEFLQMLETQSKLLLKEKSPFPEIRNIESSIKRRINRAIKTNNLLKQLVAKIPDIMFNCDNADFCPLEDNEQILNMIKRRIKKLHRQVIRTIFQRNIKDERIKSLKNKSNGIRNTKFKIIEQIPRFANNCKNSND